MRAAAETFAVTPPVGAANQSRTGVPVERVFSPLKTTLTLIEAEGQRICVISSHHQTHYYRFSNLLRQRVAAVLGLPFEQVIDFSSHNHCVVKLVEDQHPSGELERDLWLSEQHLTEEGKKVIEHADASAWRLPDRLEEVTLRWGRGHERRISHNRKGRRADGSTYMIRETDRLALGADFNGDIDDEAAVIGFFGSDGAPRCLLGHFTAHPVTAFNPEHPVVFGEFPQVACDALSQAMGDVPVGFLQGCAGDVNAKGLLADQPIEQSVRDAARYGHCLAQTWLDAITRGTASETETLDVHRRIVKLPFAEVPPRQHLEAQLAEIDDFLQRCAEDDPNTRACQGLTFPGHMSPRYRAALVEPLRKWTAWAHAFHAEGSLAQAPDAAEFEVVSLRIGDVGVVGMTCEPFDAIGRQIKAGSPRALTLPCGYMHDNKFAYVPNAGNNGDLDYMSAFYRYTTSMLPYAQPAGDRLAEAALTMMNPEREVSA